MPLPKLPTFRAIAGSRERLRGPERPVPGMDRDPFQPGAEPEEDMGLLGKIGYAPPFRGEHDHNSGQGIVWHCSLRFSCSTGIIRGVWFRSTCAPKYRISIL